ncbi:hypothetical protein [Streptomyces sp. NEAU-S77]|uniref:hypothetical protein n=1 Tax=Streptomyces sp. NEAU-S77 TaxID=3411033 RepID=UPI003BA30E4B
MPAQRSRTLPAFCEVQCLGCLIAGELLGPRRIRGPGLSRVGHTERPRELFPRRPMPQTLADQLLLLVVNDAANRSTEGERSDHIPGAVACALASDTRGVTFPPVRQ